MQIQDLPCPKSRPAAFPILIAHITRDYPEGVLESIGRGLSHKSARAWWPELKRIYLETNSPAVQGSLSLSNDPMLGREATAILSRSRGQ